MSVGHSQVNDTTRSHPPSRPTLQTEYARLEDIGVRGRRGWGAQVFKRQRKA